MQKRISLVSMFKFVLLVSLFVNFLTSCNNQQGAFSSKPVAMGRINNVVILSDKNISEGAVGDSITYYFESSYPVLPADEAMFDLRFMEPADLNAEPLRRELRTFVIVADVSDTTSVTTKMLKQDLGKEKFERALIDTSFTTSIGADKWARDQMVIYLFANGEKRLIDAIEHNFPAVAKRINQHDQKNLY